MEIHEHVFEETREVDEKLRNFEIRFIFWQYKVKLPPLEQNIFESLTSEKKSGRIRWPAPPHSKRALMFRGRWRKEG